MAFTTYRNRKYICILMYRHILYLETPCRTPDFLFYSSVKISENHCINFIFKAETLVSDSKTRYVKTLARYLGSYIKPSFLTLFSYNLFDKQKYNYLKYFILIFN